jgi:DNA polymerase-3 subunit gamma/tau
MSYEVLARKWRPRNFDTLVGQEHVVKALVNALEQQRLHHAYLFTGTRGVGKTTIARILAKALNCETGITARPCGECSACQEIDSGRFVDLLEIDAASRTKVEDTRELLENVQYAPTRARFKVYLIDEVHMLSSHSFNALLKTLEEPPPHVKFLLATTDPQKLPVTVLSRCLQFNLRHVPADAIADHLLSILATENIEAEPAAVQRIARAARGSMRDALSLLDQAIAFGDGRVSSDDIAQMLGDVPRERVYDLLDALADGDAGKLLAQAAKLAETVSDFSAVLDDLSAALQRLAVLLAVPEQELDDPQEQQRLAALAERLSPEDVQLYYQIALLGRRDLPLAPDPLSGFEMVMLRMHAFRPAVSGTPPAAARGPAGSGTTSQDAEPSPVIAQQTRVADSPVPPEETDWHKLLAGLQLRGLPYEVAANCELLASDATGVKLRLDQAHLNLLSDTAHERIEKALCETLQRKLRLEIDVGITESETPAERKVRLSDERYLKARESIANDPLVQALQDGLGAEVDDDSVRPLDA